MLPFVQTSSFCTFCIFYNLRYAKLAALAHKEATPVISTDVLTDTDKKNNSVFDKVVSEVSIA